MEWLRGAIDSSSSTSPQSQSQSQADTVQTTADILVGTSPNKDNKQQVRFQGNQPKHSKHINLTPELGETSAYLDSAANVSIVNGRGDIWYTLSSQGNISSVPPRLVSKLLRLNALDIDIIEQIDRDIPRTYPDKPEFVTIEFQSALRQVLRAIATEYKSIGYVQGMNFIVAVLLKNCDNDLDRAFGLFVRLMEGPKYMMKDVYKPGLPKLIKFSQCLEKIISLRYPALSDHLHRVGIEPLFYSQNWIITLFAYNGCFQIVYEIWEMFFADGWYALFAIGICSIGSVATTLIDSDFEQCAQEFRLFDKNPPLDVCIQARKIVLTSEEKSIVETFLSSQTQRPNRFSTGSTSTIEDSPDSSALAPVDFTTAIALAGTETRSSHIR